jgi:hypothetical protein
MQLNQGRKAAWLKASKKVIESPRNQKKGQNYSGSTKPKRGGGGLTTEPRIRKEEIENVSINLSNANSSHADQLQNE